MIEKIWKKRADKKVCVGMALFSLLYLSVLNATNRLPDLAGLGGPRTTFKIKSSGLFSYTNCS